MSDERSLLEDYLDGALSDEDRATFEQQLEGDAALQAEVELQHKIDAALADRFGQVPDADAILARAREQAEGRLLRPSFWRRAGTLIAAAAVLALVAGSVWWSFKSGTTPQPEVAAVDLHTIYDRKVERGFKPDWQCELRSNEFRGAHKNYAGQDLVMDDPAQDVKPLGLGYVHAFDTRTVIFLAEVRGEKVLVFVDEVAKDREVEQPPKDSGLHLHRRVVGKAVLYELSPLAEPHVLKHYRVP